MYICVCRKISEDDLNYLKSLNLDLEQEILCQYGKAQCGACLEDIKND